MNAYRKLDIDIIRAYVTEGEHDILDVLEALDRLEAAFTTEGRAEEAERLLHEAMATDLNLDPYPYRNKYDNSRWTDPGVDYTGNTVVFDPRPEYSQDREDYS